MLPRVCAFVTATLSAMSAAAAAQTVSDGVQAIARGDYASAATLLRPLAENTPTPDPAAQFFLAMLYQTGSGVHINTLHACTLYLQASKTPNAFSSQAAALGQTILDPLPPLLREFCAADEWREPEPVTFTLAPDHRIRVDATGTTISYRGEQRYTQGHFGGAGWIFIPPKHTPINVSSPSPARRHFIEVFTWRPNMNAATRTWTLAWTLSEIVGLDSIFVAGEMNVVAVEGAQPPSDFDVTSAARVQLDADGAAEWVVAGGPNPRSGKIPLRYSR